LVIGEPWGLCEESRLRRLNERIASLSPIEVLRHQMIAEESICSWTIDSRSPYSGEHATVLQVFIQRAQRGLKSSNNAANKIYSGLDEEQANQGGRQTAATPPA